MKNKNTHIWYRSVLLTLVLAGTACTPQNEEEAAETQDPATGPGQNFAPSEGFEAPVRQVAPPGDQINFAMTDLAAQLGVSVDDVEAQAAQAVSWRSGALGCPEKGVSYTHAIIPGVLILLEVDGKTYRYHASSDGMPFHCPDGRVESPTHGAGNALM